MGHLAYYWSPDWGDTWIGHPDNPIIAPGQFPEGVPSEGFQRTPTLLVDEEYERYILGYNAGHDINEKWKRRTYLATSSRPYNPPPEKPIISGPEKGIPDSNYEFDFTNCFDPEGDDMIYYVDWGDGDMSEGFVESGDSFSLSHSWSNKGEYTIKSKLIDIFGGEGNWSDPFIIIISNPPEAPTINGPNKGVVGVEYNYTFITSDPEEEDIYYWINWGDNSPPVEWIGPYKSGEMIILSHIFLKEGKITISAQAMDINQLKGEWGTFEIVIPRNKLISISLLFRILKQLL
jgi:hypothetical protein